MKEIFVAYAKEDKVIAKKLVSKLQTDGYSCSIIPRDIPANNAEELKKTISESRIFVLLLSQSAEKIDELYKQLEIAVDESIPVIPFKVAATSNNLGLKHMLHTLEWVDAHGDGFGDAYDVLKEIILEIYGGKVPEKIVKTKTIKPAASKPEISKNNIIIGVLSILLLLFVFLYFSEPKNGADDNNSGITNTNIPINNFNTDFKELTEAETDLVGAWKVIDYEDNRKMSEQERVLTLQNIEVLKQNGVVVFNADRSFKRSGFSPTLDQGYWEFDSEKKQIFLKDMNNSPAGILNLLEYSNQKLTIVVVDNIDNGTGQIEQVTTKITMEKQ